jgi:hypothetical protein
LEYPNGGGWGRGKSREIAKEIPSRLSGPVVRGQGKDRAWVRGRRCEEAARGGEEVGR